MGSTERTTCQVCYEGFVLNDESECVSSGTGGTQSCLPNCAQCTSEYVGSTERTTCQVCDEGFVLNDESECVSSGTGGTGTTSTKKRIGKKHKHQK